MWQHPQGDRLRELEIAQAKNLWIEKIAYAGLTAVVGAIIGGLSTIL